MTIIPNSRKIDVPVDPCVLGEERIVGADHTEREHEARAAQSPRPRG